MTVTGARVAAGAVLVLAALASAGCGTAAAHRAAPGVSLAGGSRTRVPCAAAAPPVGRRAVPPAGPAARPVVPAPAGGVASGPAAGPQQAGLPVVSSRPAVRVSTPAVTRLGTVRLGVPASRRTGHRWCRMPVLRPPGRCPPWLLRRYRRGGPPGRRPLFAIPAACLLPPQAAR